MSNSNSSKAELLQYIKEETVSLDKYNKLQDKLEMKNKVVEGVQKQVEEKNKVIESLEDAIKLKDKETKGVQERFNKEKQIVLDEANKYIEKEIARANTHTSQMIAQAQATLQQGEYLKGLLVNSFSIIDVLKSRAVLDMESIDKLIEVFKTSVIDIEITEKGDEL